VQIRPCDLPSSMAFVMIAIDQKALFGWAVPAMGQSEKLTRGISGARLYAIEGATI